jgi:3-phosphoshikimate 1-carboxyvinyltransferase
VGVSVDDDDIRISGRSRRRGAAGDSHHDQRQAMTISVAGLLATGETTVLRPASAAISYPGFFDDLGRVAS